MTKPIEEGIALYKLSLADKGRSHIQITRNLFLSHFVALGFDVYDYFDVQTEEPLHLHGMVAYKDYEDCRIATTVYFYRGGTRILDLQHTIQFRCDREGCTNFGGKSNVYTRECIGAIKFEAFEYNIPALCANCMGEAHSQVYGSDPLEDVHPDLEQPRTIQEMADSRRKQLTEFKDNDEDADPSSSLEQVAPNRIPVTFKITGVSPLQFPKVDIEEST